MNYTIAQRMLAAATSAYEVQLDGSFTPDAHYYNPLGVHGQPTAFDGGKHEIDAGFFSLIEPEKSGHLLDAVLAFRGTLGSWKHGSWSSFFAFVDDWLQDDSTRHVPFILGGQRIGCVAHGFHRALDRVWALVEDALRRVDWTQVDTLYITGHSKGAAMTFLAAAMVKHHFPTIKKIEVHAFAAPLAGDPAFAQWYNAAGLDLTTTRYQRVNDVVPFVPPARDWDLFRHLPYTWHPEGLLIEAAIKTLSLNVFGGYQEVGTLIGLVTEDPKNSMMRHQAAEFLQKALTHTIYLGDGKKIGMAHSATDSYWPALFNPVNAAPESTKT